MALHREMEQRNIFEQHPERPDRIIAIFAQLEIDGLVDRCIQVYLFLELMKHDGIAKVFIPSFRQF